MSFKFPKHPKEMNKTELYEMHKLVQEQEKNQNRHYPLYTSIQPPNGAPATADHMHEDATRDQLSRYHDELAMAGAPKTAANSVGVLRDGAELKSQVNKVMENRNKELMQDYANAELLPSDFALKLNKDNPDGFVGDRQKIIEEYTKLYLEIQNNKRK